MRQNTISTIWSALIILTLAVNLSFAAPDYINYQGHLTDMDGAPMNGTVSITFSIYSESIGGIPLWSETHDEIAVTGGHFTAIIGEFNPLPEKISDRQIFYLGVTVGSDEEMTPRQPLIDSGEWNGGNYSTDQPESFYLSTSDTCWGISNTGSGWIFHGKTEHNDGLAAKFEKNYPSGSSAPCVSINSNAENAAVSACNTNGSDTAAAAGSFKIDNGSSTAPAVYATTNGPGPCFKGNAVHAYGLAARFEKDYPSGASYPCVYINSNAENAALSARNTNGSGVGATAGSFEIINGSSTAPVLYATTNGTGPCVKGSRSSGVGESGYFSNSNSSNTDPTLFATTNGTGPAFRAVSTSGDSIAAHIAVTNSNSIWPSLVITNAGSGIGVYSLKQTTGMAAAFQMINDTTTTPCVYVSSNGYGHAISAYMTGVGNCGAFGIGNSSNGAAAVSAGTDGTGYAVWGRCTGTGNAGYFEIDNNSNSNNALYVTTNGSGDAGYFNGDVTVTGDISITGNLSKGSGSFKIDHPLDPANKYLYHSFVESPDMMNVHNGNVTLDNNGEAWVDLPDWFQAVNRDFRYQLTAIGAPGPNLYISEEITNNEFKISGGVAGMKVSWQVTGIRQDAFANAHRIQVEVDKTGDQRGKYLHPVEHGQPETMGIDYRPPVEQTQ